MCARGLKYIFQAQEEKEKTQEEVKINCFCRLLKFLTIFCTQFTTAFSNFTY